MTLRLAIPSLALSVTLLSQAPTFADQPGSLGVSPATPQPATASFADVSGGRATSGHGIDEMYDLMQNRCHSAGGGMVNYPEGYRCEDPNGNQIPY